MELPREIVLLIKEFSHPMTRPDWREGCYYKRFLNCEFIWTQTIIYCGEFFEVYDDDMYDDEIDYADIRYHDRN